ncbi:hypothetical protein, partial [Klebsiella aerogenes]|uniref:hypothetical protein n=1 Tax=Klebsiella aerogenes TaxID=548 RepID=UPI00195486D6
KKRSSIALAMGSVKGLASRLPLLHRLFGLSAGIGGAKTLFVALAIVRALFVGRPPSACHTRVSD